MIGPAGHPLAVLREQDRAPAIVARARWVQLLELQLVLWSKLLQVLYGVAAAFCKV